MSTTPYHLHATPEQVVTLTEGGDPEQLLLDRPGLARRIYLKGADFKAFGFSDGCPKCDVARRDGPGRTTAPHSEQYRQRVMIELMKTPEGIARISQALIRGERSVAEQVETQPAQGEMVDGVCDVLRKADAEDLRFEDRVERIPLPAASEQLPPRDVPSAGTATVPGGDGGDAFDTTDFHREVNDEIDKDRADRIANDPGRTLTLLRRMRMLTSASL